MKFTAMAILMVFFIHQSARADDPPPPLGVYVVNSACNDAYDDARVDLAFTLAAAASDDLAGAPRIPLDQRIGAVEGLRALYSSCRKAELDYEMNLIDPAGDPGKAKAPLDGATNNIRGVAMEAHRRLGSISLVDATLSNGPYGHLRQLLADIRGSQKYMRSSELLRSSFQSLLGASLQGLVDCETGAKQQKDAQACIGVVIQKLAVGETQIRKFLSDFGVPIAQLGNELDQITASKGSALAQATQLKAYGQNLMAAIQQSTGTLQYLMSLPPQLDQQARQLDAYQKYFLWLGYQYYYAASWCASVRWWGGYYYYIACAYCYWWWYGYFNFAFVTLTQVIIPNLWNTIHAYEAQLQNFFAQQKTLKGQIDNADKATITLVQQMHAKRQQIMSTCLPPKDNSIHPPSSGVQTTNCVSLQGANLP